MSRFLKGALASEMMLLALRTNMSIDEIKDEISIFLDLLKDAEKWKKGNEISPPSP